MEKRLEEFSRKVYELAMETLEQEDAGDDDQRDRKRKREYASSGIE